MRSLTPCNPNPTCYFTMGGGLVITRAWKPVFRGGYLTTDEAMHYARYYKGAVVVSAQGTRAGDVANVFVPTGLSPF